MVQAVWSTAHGRPLEMTDGATGEQIVRLAAHVDPVLVLLAPLWLAVPSPLTLALVQIAAVSLGALPLFWLARLHTGSERVAGLIALAYLAYPWVAWSAADAFHPVTLAIPLFLFAFWFLETDRLIAFGACAVLITATGELMGAIIGALGIWYALARRKYRPGLLIAGAGFGWTVVALLVVVPAFAGSESAYYGLFDHVGGSPWGVAKTAATDPMAILSAVTEGRDIVYLVLLGVPLAGLFFLAPGLAALVLPQLGVNLLARVNATTDPHAHYVAGIVPFLFLAIVIGMKRLPSHARLPAAAFALVLSLATSAILGPWPGALAGAPGWYRTDASPELTRALQTALDLVPTSAPVSATNKLGSRLAARRYAYTAPVIGRAEWLVLDSTDTWIPQRVGGYEDPERLREFIRRVDGDPDWRKVFEAHGVLVYRRAER
jgi:uncharacterized membrane protein